MNSVTAEPVDARLQSLRAWLARELHGGVDRVEPASADASFRRYFRVWCGGESLIAMDAPPERQSIVAYVAVAGMLAGLGLSVPLILAHDETQGFLLASDLGTRQYLDDLTPGNVERLYSDALRALCVIQVQGRDAARRLPSYDRELLLREMQLMPEWFCARHLRAGPGAAEQRLLARAFEVLIESALGQPQVFVHRDFHSRNLMVLAEGNPGILDFQDAVRGPVTYDLVSLLKDCYIAWPRERVLGWVRNFRAMAAAAGVEVGDSEQTYVRWFDLMGLQRHLKVLGIFARLFHRDGKPGYLRDLPRVLDYAIEASAQYAELHELARFLERSLRPLLEVRTAEALA